MNTKQERSKTWWVLPLGVALGAASLLAGCPQQGVVCSQGLERCGLSCADLQSDVRNCGACGKTCASGQACANASCVCQQGTVACADGCVVLASDPRHCGACGRACQAGQVCEQNTCKAECQLGISTLCGQSCVNLNSDVLHCGGCGRACEASQSCREGICTYDVVAACFSSGQVTGLQAASGFRGPRVALGSAPGALAIFQDVLLSADAFDKKLYQARLSSVGGQAFAKYAEAFKVGGVPNHVVVDEPYVYVANAQSGTVQVLSRPGPDAGVGAGVVDGGGRFPAGLQLSTIAELQLGANTWPEAVAKLGQDLYVPLYGGMGRAAAASGQKVVRISVKDPYHPAVVDTYDLSGLDLRAFDGGSPVPRPFSITEHNGKLLVALNNLNPDTYEPEGPGLLARIDPVTRAVEVVELGADACLNPIWVRTAKLLNTNGGPHVYVSCQGKVVYAGPPSYEALYAEKSGVVELDHRLKRFGVWTAGCPADAGAFNSDAGTGCLPVVAGRFAETDGQLFVGDQNGGRVFALGTLGLAELRGYRADAGPIQACPLDPISSVSNVSDVVAAP